MSSGEQQKACVCTCTHMVSSAVEDQRGPGLPKASLPISACRCMHAHTHMHKFKPKKCGVKAGLTLPLNRALWLLSFLLLHLFLQSVNVNNDLEQNKNKLESISTFRARSHPGVVERQVRKVTISVSHQLHTRAENQCSSLCRNMKKLNYSSSYVLVTCMCTPMSFKTYSIK